MPLWLADSVLRGVGQVMLQNSAWTGLLFLAGIAWNAPLIAAGVVVGTAASTFAVVALGAERRAVRDGLYGFNGALVAVALLVFLKPDVLTWGCVVFAAAASTVLMAALTQALKPWQVPALTAPFVLTALCFFLALARFGRLQPTGLLPSAGLPAEAVVEGVVTAATVGLGLLDGVAQVFFQGSAVTGAVFLLGLLVASKRVCAVALAGSAVGLLTAWGMGAAEEAIRSGAFGFNAVLTAVALGTVFLRMDALAWVYTLTATVVSTLLFATLSAALQPLGMPAMTAPFVLATWVFLLAVPLFPRLRWS